MLKNNYRLYLVCNFTRNLMIACMIPKYVNEGKDKQGRTTDCEQPQYQEVRYSSIVQLYKYTLLCNNLSTIPVTEMHNSYTQCYYIILHALFMCFELSISINSLKVSENKSNNEYYPSNNTGQDKRNCQL